MSIHTLLAIVAVIWSLGVIETLVEGAWLLTRDRVEQAVSRWTWSVSMIGLALTFIVAIQRAPVSWASSNGQPVTNHAQ
jgi:hypothetical protein